MIEHQARALLASRSGGACERCAHRRASEVHFRREGGGWGVANLLHLCARCKSDIGGDDRVAFEQGWAVPVYADPAKTPVWFHGLGFVLLTNQGEIKEIDDEQEGAA